MLKNDLFEKRVFKYRKVMLYRFCQSINNNATSRVEKFKLQKAGLSRIERCKYDENTSLNIIRKTLTADGENSLFLAYFNTNYKAEVSQGNKVCLSVKMGTKTLLL